MKQKSNVILPESLPIPRHPIKSSALTKAVKAVEAALFEHPESRTIDEMRMFLAHETCLTQDEIDAAIAKLIGFKTIVGNERDGYIPAAHRVWFEAVVIGARSGNYQVEHPDSGVVFVLRGTEHLPVLAGDRVLACPTGIVDNGVRIAQIKEVLARSKKRILCRFMGESHEEGWIWAIPIDPFSPTPVLVETKRRNLKRQAFEVELSEELKAFHRSEVALSGRLIEILGELDDADVELEIASRRFEIPTEFAAKTIAEVSKFPDTVSESELSGRVDLRDIGLMTIDGEDARDFDDAVWAAALPEGGWRLLVAIADVSHYVCEGTSLNEDAQRRATSVYFPRRVIPMLPEKLSNGLCSLNPGVDRAALVCDMVVDSEGTVSAYQFYPALIRSTARLTYTAVWAAMQGDASDLRARGGSPEDIATLVALFTAFRDARERRGAIDFETSETQVVCDEKTGKITAIRRRDHNDAHRIIEECMLAANTCAADFIARKEAVSLYRIHDVPTAERLENLRATLAALNLTLGGGSKPKASDFGRVLETLKDNPGLAETVQLAMLRSMPQAFYSPINIGHYGLNYGSYTHFTSPIRRYPDLLVHRTIRSLLDGQTYEPRLEIDPTPLLESRPGRLLEKLAGAVELRAETPQNASRLLWRRLGLMCSAAERRADEASRDVTAWLKCDYMRHLLGECFEATVTSVMGAGLYVTLKDVFVEGFVHISHVGDDYYHYDPLRNTLRGEDWGESFRIGDTVFVRLIEVDCDSRRIDFEIDAAATHRFRRPEPAVRPKTMRKRR